jgi:hypothetical protein
MMYVAIFAGLGHCMGKAPDAPAEWRRNGRAAHNAVSSPMGIDGLDWLFDAPIPCPTCGKAAVAKIAILKAHSSIGCGYCGAPIELTDPGTRGFVEEFSRVVASLYSVIEDSPKQG